MRFTLVDRILEYQPGVKLTAVKCLSLSEDYLKDHFPRFPVLPGVLMLEAMAQAGAWLVRMTENFAHSVVVLKEAKNIKYADFIQPGEVLTVTVEVIKQDERETHLKAQGTVGGQTAVGGRLVLERYNLSDTKPELAPRDAYLNRKMRELLVQLHQPEGAAAAIGRGESN